nr:thioredoxin fold domain-containing protein [uncultured Flavobacterium sp.]
MKASIKHVCILIFVLLTITSKAQSIAVPKETSIIFYQNDYKLALEQSKVYKKTIFVMVYATWSTHCNKMKSTILKEPAVIAFFNSNFINLMMDSETPAGKEFMKKYNVKTFPAFLFLDEKETLLYSTEGKFTGEEFIAEAKKAKV